MSWDSSEGPGSTYAESDEKITHHVVDRPSQKHRYLSRYFPEGGGCGGSRVTGFISALQVLHPASVGV